MNTTAGFVGTIKQRFMDFMVHEVDTSGALVNLTTIAQRAKRKPKPSSSSSAQPKLLTYGQYLAGSSRMQALKALYGAGGQATVSSVLEVEAGALKEAFIPAPADKGARTKVWAE